MASRNISMRSGNKGLTVRIYLWALEKYIDNFNPTMARFWMSGQVTNADTGKTLKFNDAGQLITILGKWNAEKFKQLRSKRKASRA